MTAQNEQAKIEKKREIMLTRPIPALVAKMAVPTIISMLVTAFYNLADTYFVGKLKSNAATGAVGIVFALMAIIQAIGFFFGHGSGNYISRKLGKGDYEKAAKMAATGFFSALAAGVVISVVGLCFQAPLARLLGATDTMLNDTVAYMRIILIGAPYMMAALVLNNQLRLQGNAFFSMIGLVSGAVLNIALDPLLIFTFNMGVAGAALATIISQLVSFVILLIGCQKSSNVTIRLSNFSFSAEYFKGIAGGGLPSLSRQGLASVSTLMLNNFAGNYGDAAIAAFSVITKITMIAISIILGFGQGFQPVCGFNYGAKKYSRVKQAVWFSVKCTTAFLIVAAAIIYALAPQAVAVFRDDGEVIKIGSQALRYQCVALPFVGFIIMMNMFLQNIQRVIPASTLAMARQGLIFIPLLILLVKSIGLTGLLLAQPIADIITFIIAIPLSAPALRELNRADGEYKEKLD